MAILEPPQKPYTAVSADFQQLNPIDGRALVRRFVETLPAQELRTIHRTKDPVLRSYCMRVRSEQPSRQEVDAFFAGRIYSCALAVAVRQGLERALQAGQLYVWPCVTNAGADAVNRAALTCCGVTEKAMAAGYPRRAESVLYSYCGAPRPDYTLTRNLDKDCAFHPVHVDIVVEFLLP